MPPKHESVSHWRKIIKNAERFMEPKRKQWHTLLQAYNNIYDVAGLSDEHIVRVPRIAPLVRQVIASIAFHYPKVFIGVEGNKRAEEVLERIANNALEVMQSKGAIHQALFDSLFNYRGFVALDYNPPGDDSVAPYVANDFLEEDFPCLRHVPSENMLVDPLTPANAFHHARFAIEKMVVPVEFVHADEERFGAARKDVTPMSDDPEEMMVMSELNETDPEEDAVKEARDLGEMTLLHVIHDRVHRRRMTLGHGTDKWLENEEHPMLSRAPVTQQDPYNPELTLMADEGEAKGYLLRGGLPFYSIQLDMSDKFWGTPMMEYENDLQKLIVESVSRRVDILKRFKRLAVASRQERKSNPNLGKDLETGEDGTVIYLDDIGAIRELQWGNPPPDQVQIERDAMFYESQLIKVAGSSRGRSATETAVLSSVAELNREWMQIPVVECYRWVVDGILSMFSDPRWVPADFLINTAPEGQPAVMEGLAALAQYWPAGRWKVTVEPGSMRPLVEQLDRDDTLALVDRLRQSPHIDQMELDKMQMEAFRKVHTDKLIKDQVDPTEMALIGYENQYLINGQDPGVQEGFDHQMHMAAQSPEALSQMPQFQGMPPELQQSIYAVAQQHLQQHQQMMAQEASLGGVPAAPAAGNVPKDLISQVRSNAQEISDAVQVE